MSDQTVNVKDATLESGVRVQVQISTCARHGLPENAISMFSLTNGRMGVIREIKADETLFEGPHPYWVWFDRPVAYSFDGRNHTVRASLFAAAELVVIDGDPGAPAHPA